MAINTTEYCVDSDGCSSIYSRSPDAPKLHRTSNDHRQQSALRTLPEINSLDHQIAMARGTTIALETTRTRLRESKDYQKISALELRHQKLYQLEQHNHENHFYGTCYEQFLELSKVVTDVAQNLALQYHFESDTSMDGSINIRKAAQVLRESLENSKDQESRAEQRWKRQWDILHISNPTASSI